MSCDHDLDPEYLYPSDAQILDFHDDDGTLVIRVAVPCPECDESVAIEASAERIEAVDLEIPLGDPEDPYD